MKNTCLKVLKFSLCFIRKKKERSCEMFYREKCLHVCKSYAQHIHDLKKVELESRKNAWSQCSISLVPRTFLIIRTTGDGKSEGREGRV